MSKAFDFIRKLKNAGEAYQASYLTRVQSLIGYSSSPCQHLASRVAGIPNSDDQSIIFAITEVRAYMLRRDYNELNFFSGYLKPLLDELAQDPINDLSPGVISALQQLEFETAPSMGGGYQGPLMNHLGYGSNTGERHPTLAEDLKTTAGKAKWLRHIEQQDSEGCTIRFRIPPYSILKPYFEANQHELANEPKVVGRGNLHMDQGNPLLTLAFKSCRPGEEFLRILQSFKHTSDSLKQYATSFLFTLTKPHLGGLPAVIELESTRQAQHLKDTNETILCLKEIARLSMLPMTVKMLHSIIKNNSEYLQKTRVNYDELAVAIISDETWKAALLNSDSEIALEKILPETGAKALRSALTTAVPEVTSSKVFSRLFS